MAYAYAETSNKTTFSIIAAVLFAIRSYALQSNRNDAELHIELAARRLYKINLQSVFLQKKIISHSPVSAPLCSALQIAYRSPLNGDL